MLAVLLAALMAVPQVPVHTTVVTSLDRGWLFAPGDGANRALPRVEDGDWHPVRVPGSLAEAGFAGFSGVGWYRVRVTFEEPPDRPLVIHLESVSSAYELYVDGELLTRMGEFPPHSRPLSGVAQSVHLPVASLGRGPHVIALRVHLRSPQGGILGRVRIAPVGLLEAADRRTDLYLLTTALFLLGISIHQLLLWLRRPQAREQLYLFLFVVALSLFFLSASPALRSALAPWVYWYRLYNVFAAVAVGFLLFSVRGLFDLDRDRLLLGGGTAMFLLVLPALVLPERQHLVWLARFLLNPGTVAAVLGMLWVLFAQARQGATSARLLLWGAAPFAFAVVHDISLDWSILPRRAAFPWLVHVGAVAFVLSVAAATARRFAETETIALYDRLTGLYRREVVLDALRREIRRAARTRQPLAVIMMDIDHFKAVNDALGHQTGDRVLAEVGRRLQEAGRAVDWLCRYGGEEFLAILADSDREGAALAAERFRQAVGALPIDTGRGARVVTLSAGVAAYDGGAEWPTAETLVGGADAALYQAKGAGRDQVR